MQEASSNTEETARKTAEMPSSIETNSGATWQDETAALDGAVKNHPLNFIIDSLHKDDDPWLIEWMMFHALNGYLQPGGHLTAEEVALCLDALLPDNRPNTADDPKEDREETASFICELSDLIWKIAKQIPHDHESQDKLVQLIPALQRRPITVMVQRFDISHQTLWQPVWRGGSLDGWDDSQAHAFCDVPVDRPNTDGKTREQLGVNFVNVNAFAARMQAAGVMPSRPSYALSAIVMALEPERVTVHGYSPQLGPYYILAGSQWMVHAAQWFWGEIRWGHVANFPLTSSDTELPPAQWARWMRLFREVPVADSNAKCWAEQAARSMAKVMSEHGYTEETMLAWNAEEHIIHDGIHKDPRYAHIFKLRSGESSSGIQQTPSEPGKGREISLGS